MNPFENPNPAAPAPAEHLRAVFERMRNPGGAGFVARMSPAEANRLLAGLARYVARHKHELTNILRPNPLLDPIRLAAWLRAGSLERGNQRDVSATKQLGAFASDQQARDALSTIRARALDVNWVHPFEPAPQNRFERLAQNGPPPARARQAVPTLEQLTLHALSVDQAWNILAKWVGRDDLFSRAAEPAAQFEMAVEIALQGSLTSSLMDKIVAKVDLESLMRDPNIKRSIPARQAWRKLAETIDRNDLRLRYGNDAARRDMISSCIGYTGEANVKRIAEVAGISDLRIKSVDERARAKKPADARGRTFDGIVFQEDDDLAGPSKKAQEKPGKAGELGAKTSNVSRGLPKRSSRDVGHNL